MSEDSPVNDVKPNNAVATRRTLRRVIGMVLFSALVASWFIWGPLGLVCYVGGRFNSLSVFVLTFPFVMLAPLVIILLPVLIIRSIIYWGRLSERARVRLSLALVALTGLVASFGLGFAGIVPSAFDMFVRGFAGYAESHADVAAIQTWLGTLDPKDYVGSDPQSGGVPIPAAEHPPAITRLHPIPRPHGVRISRNDTGQLMVRLLWGGGFIGHWGIEVGDERMGLPPASEFYGYRPLAPGAWIWYELN